MNKLVFQILLCIVVGNSILPIKCCAPNSDYYDFFKNNYQYYDNTVEKQNDLINNETINNNHTYEKNDLKEYYENYYEFNYYDKYYDYFKYNKPLD